MVDFITKGSLEHRHVTLIDPEEILEQNQCNQLNIHNMYPVPPELHFSFSLKQSLNKTLIIDRYMDSCQGFYVYKNT